MVLRDLHRRTLPIVRGLAVAQKSTFHPVRLLTSVLGAKPGSPSAQRNRALRGKGPDEDRISRKKGCKEVRAPATNQGR